MIPRQRHRWWLVIVAVGFVVVMGAIPRSHTPIASRWNFNEHLFPIFNERCGSCHIDGGIAPMSLVAYQSAFPWTQSIREEVLGLRMPPWQAEDGFGTFKNGHALSAQEMNIVLEWASGGYPEGPRDQAPESPAPPDSWRLGEPHLALEVPGAFALDASTSEAVRFFVIPSEVTTDRSIIGVDLLPGARAVVRGAAVFLDTTGLARSLDEADPAAGFADGAQGFPVTPPVAVWTPGQLPVLNANAGYTLPAGADVVLRVHYKKTWITEGMDFSDQSRVGLYFADGDIDDIESLLVTSPSEVTGRDLLFTHELGDTVTVLALLPEVDIESSELKIEAVTPDGERIPMLWLREPDRGWPTRFWFDTPLLLPAGSKLEVRALLDPAAERIPKATLLGDDSAPIRFIVDYVTGALSAN